MTSRDRAHRAFCNAAVEGAADVPMCFASGMGARKGTITPCGALCNRVTDAIEIARAEAIDDVTMALRERAAMAEADRSPSSTTPSERRQGPDPVRYRTEADKETYPREDSDL